MSTSQSPVRRRATACVRSNYDELLVKVELRHRVGNSEHDEDRRAWNNVPSGSTTPDDLVIRYVTNPEQHPPHDYWYAELTLDSDERFETAQDFIMDLHAGDENKIVTAIIENDKLTIQSYSGSQSTDWKKVQRF